MPEPVWRVVFHYAFKQEFDGFPIEVRKAIMAVALVLQRMGPGLGRPHVDTLNGSDHANMKELRCSAGDGVWRIAFAFDPERRAILLAGGDKAGVAQKRFYKSLVKKADVRFSEHLEELRREEK